MPPPPDLGPDTTPGSTPPHQPGPSADDTTPPSGYAPDSWPAPPAAPTPPAGSAPPPAGGYGAPLPPGPVPGAPAPPGGGYVPPFYGTPAYGTPAYGTPAYGTPAYGTPGYGAPEHGAHGYPPAGPGTGGYGPGAYAPPGYVAPGWNPPGPEAAAGGGPGFGPPDVPGAAPWGTWHHWAPPPAAPQGTRWQRTVRSVAAAWTAVAVLVLAVGGMALALALQSPSGSPTPTTTPSFGVPPGSSGGALPTTPGNTGNSGSSSSGATGSTGSGSTSPGQGGPSSSTTASIASAVDPGLVDIDTTLDQGGGAAGTGMVLTSAGLVLTNNHVIENATSVTAQVDGQGRVYDVTVLGYSVTDDIALVQLQGASGLATVSTGSSTDLSLGQSVVAIGNALGRGGTPRAVGGAITGLDQTITAGDPGTIQETLHGVIEMNAPIQSGDSGGPVVDLAGKVVGMNTAASQGGGGFGAEGSTDQAYAIGISNALSIVDQIRAGKASTNVEIGPRALLGVEVTDGPTTGGGFGGSTGNTGSGTTPGAYVEQVEAGSPAGQAGITTGDTIVSVDGTTVSSSSDLGNALQGFKPGDVVTVGWVDADGAQHSASVTLTTGPPA